MFGNLAKNATFLENSTFPFLGNVTFSRNVANLATNVNVTFYTTGPCRMGAAGFGIHATPPTLPVLSG